MKNCQQALITCFRYWHVRRETAESTDETPGKRLHGLPPRSRQLPVCSVQGKCLYTKIGTGMGGSGRRARVLPTTVVSDRNNAAGSYLAARVLGEYEPCARPTCEQISGFPVKFLGPSAARCSMAGRCETGGRRLAARPERGRQKRQHTVDDVQRILSTTTIQRRRFTFAVHIGGIRRRQMIITIFYFSGVDDNDTVVIAAIGARVLMSSTG